MTNKYLRTIYGVDKEGNAGSLQVDVYDILEAYPTQNPALDHLIKKALCPRQRGRNLKKLQDAAEGVCAVSRIAHILDAPIGAAVVGNYREHDKCVEGRHCFNMNEALGILANDKKKDDTNA